MKIVVLDGYGLNPGDLSWNGLEALGELTVYDRTAPDELMERSSGAEVLITNKTVITAENMAALPALKYIGVLATGYNIVDIAAAKERGIIVTNIPAYSTASVAQMVFAHLLNITQRVGHYAHANRQGRFLLLGYRIDGIGWKENRHCRVGKYRKSNCTHCFCFRDEGVCVYFESTVSIA